MNASPADILRFLPSADLSRGPFGLLNLGPTRCDDFAIVEALQRQLRQIDSHPQRTDPAAEKVRNELYQAVAQLREGETRNTLGKRYFREAWVPAPETEREPSALEPPRPPPRTLTEAGAARSPDFVPPRLIIRDRPQRSTFGFGGAAALLLGTSLVLLLILLWLVSINPAAPLPAPRGPRQAATLPASAGPQAATSSPVSAPAQSVASERTRLPVPAAGLRPAEARDLLERLRGSAPAGADPTQATAIFDGALFQFETRWTEISADLYTPAGLAVVDRLRTASNADTRQGVALYQRIEKPLGAFEGKDLFFSPESIASAAWSAGVLNRIKSDASLPGRHVSSARTRLASLTTDGEVPRDNAFIAGVGVALDAMARRWSRPAAEPPEDVARRSWTAWSRCAAALDAVEKGVTARVVADAVDVLLRDADTQGSASSREAIETLMGTVPDWRENYAALRIIAWFDSPRVRTGQLAVVTQWLSNRGPIAGVGVSMALPPDATTIQRRELRDAYALRLGLTVASSGNDTLGTWASAARTAVAVADSEPNANPLTALAAAAGVSKLNECAARMWAMDEQAALAALSAAAPESIAAVLTPPGGAPHRVDPTPFTSPGTAPDGEWARKFLSFNNESLRVLLLNQLRNTRGPEGPVDADVVADAACATGHATVRQLAQQTVREFADRAEVINAMLEAIPDAPRQKSVSDLVRDITGASLPAPSEPDWRAACRRALVEKLMQLTGDQGDDRADALAAILWESCAGAASSFATAKNTAQPPPDSAESPAPPSPATAASDLRQRWAEAARATPEGSWAWVTYDELVRRHNVRARLVAGPIHTYLSERLGGVEMMAQCLAAERPGRAAAVREVVTDLGAALRAAPSSFHQVLSTERAALRLWLLRFGERER